MPYRNHCETSGLTFPMGNFNLVSYQESEFTMSDNISAAEARLALHTVEDQRRQIIAEIGIPTWYWAGLATGWVALGLASDLGNAWLIGSATLLFGAVHAAVGQRVLSGRRRSSRVTVRPGVVIDHLSTLLLGCLVVLGAVTTGLGFLADADGAEHAATMASIVPAVAILCGGPGLMALVRERALRDGRP